MKILHNVNFFGKKRKENIKNLALLLEIIFSIFLYLF